jgi:hypothetical protein
MRNVGRQFEWRRVVVCYLPLTSYRGWRNLETVNCSIAHPTFGGILLSDIVPNAIDIVGSVSGHSAAKIDETAG